jgi:hypothetical protein
MSRYDVGGGRNHGQRLDKDLRGKEASKGDGREMGEGAHTVEGSLVGDVVY